MKDYNAKFPSINGIISNDLLYFEGIERPLSLTILCDSNLTYNKDLLEKYFNDIYGLFLNKLSSFAISGRVQEEDSIKLQALLQEIIKVKKLLVYNS
jgi:hypothetical protein